MKRLTIFALIVLGSATTAPACGVDGVKCIKVPQADHSAPYAVGDILPRGQYQVLLNTNYHGLPASDGSFWYYRVDRHVLKVHPATMEVLADVTSKARRLTRR